MSAVHQLDPLLYHMIINTDCVPYNQAAQIIGGAVLAGVQRERHDRVRRARPARRLEAFA